MPQAGGQFALVSQVKNKVRRAERVRGLATQDDGGRERQAEADTGRRDMRQRRAEGPSGKMVTPPHIRTPQRICGRPAR